MENISIPQNTNTQSFTPVSSGAEPRQGEVQVQRVPEVNNAEAPKLDNKNPDEARFNAVKKAASRALSTNPFSTSVARFTIYRDTLADGVVFVTRFTNVNDGHVTLIQEPQLLGEFAREQGTIIDGVV